MYALTNVLRPYAWGSTTAIASLLGRKPSGAPEAELWLGAHPDSPSVASLLDGGSTPLDALIAADPEGTLGPASRAAFGDRLPFLAKILAAGNPLSLQVHPTLEQARAAFAAEEAAGVPHDAPHRNYKDDNHKPEMILALTDFEALCGFRPAAGSRRIFEHLAWCFDQAVSELPAALRDVLALLAGDSGPATGRDLPGPAAGVESALRGAFHRLISGGSDVPTAIAAVLTLLRSGAPMGDYTPELSTVVSLAEAYPGDPGVLISLLLNRVSLAPGQAIYLPAGNIHAYLRGLGVEVMASSDNVLRGGLTPKHIDVPELMKTVDFQALPVPRIDAQTTELGQQIWAPPFREFQLQRVELKPGGSPVPLAQNGPLLVILISGAAVLDSPRGDLRLERGGSAFVPARENPVILHPVSGAPETAVGFAVTLPTGT
jgi:mannose-6-phosphate isomerase